MVCVWRRGSVVEQRSHNPLVVGSIPSAAIFRSQWIQFRMNWMLSVDQLDPKRITDAPKGLIPLSSVRLPQA